MRILKGWYWAGEVHKISIQRSSHSDLCQKRISTDIDTWSLYIHIYIHLDMCMCTCIYMINYLYLNMHMCEDDIYIYIYKYVCIHIS